jgi:serine/threonine protein kinase
VVTIPGYEIGEAIHRSRLRSIWRARRSSDGLPVVLKTLAAEYPAREHVAELRREFHIIMRLQPVESVIRVHALESYGNGNLAIVLEHFGRSLADVIESERPRALPLERFFPVAIGVADALARVHEFDVVHKNVEPSNILLDGSGALRLIDFGIASELSLERQNYAASRRLEGALPYLSPEQTGRMNRDLDYRSDHYSLGVTLFQLLTGELPFRAGSVLEWVHSHIGRSPRSPSEIDASPRTATRAATA